MEGGYNATFRSRYCAASTNDEVNEWKSGSTECDDTLGEMLNSIDDFKRIDN